MSARRRVFVLLLGIAWWTGPWFAEPVLADLAADPGGPYTGVVDEKVRFDGSGSTEGDFDIDTYLWNFGDGESTDDEETDHTYRLPGTYLVTLTVIDDEGNAATASTTAVILPNQPPAPDPGGPYLGEVKKKVRFDGSGSTDNDGKITDYRWDFGDGKTGKGETPDHDYRAPGIYTVTLTVTDDDRASATLSTTATIIDPNVPIPSVSLTGPRAGAVLSGVVVIAAVTSDDSHVEMIEFQADGTPIGTDTNPPWSMMWDTAASADGDHVVSAVATDTVGRTSEDSVRVQVANGPPPSVQITNPVAGAQVHGTISLSASASADVTQVQFLVDATSLGTDQSGSDGWSVIWESTAAADGAHTMSAVATDGRGRTASDVVRFAVANQVPSTTTTLGVTTTTTFGVTTTTTQPPTTTTAGNTPSTATTVPPTTATVGATPQSAASSRTSPEVLAQQVASGSAAGLSATSFSIAPLASAPGGVITLTLELDAVIHGICEVLFLLDGSPLGDSVEVSTGRELTFSRTLPADLSAGRHRIEVVASSDRTGVLASRTVGLVIGGSVQAAPLQPGLPVGPGASAVPVLLALALIVVTALARGRRRRWSLRRTRT